MGTESEEYIQELTDPETGAVIFRIVVDRGMGGTAITEYGIWYSPSQVSEICRMLKLANDFI